MNDRRRLFKRIFISVIYVVIFTGIGTGFYFLFKKEQVALPPPAPTIHPVETIWAQSFLTGPNIYSVAAKVRNPNTNFGASDFGYSFYLYDSNNVLIATLNGSSFIWPGESKYIVVGGVSVSKAPVKLGFEVKNPVWREVLNFKGVDLTLSNINYGKGSPGSGKFYMVDFTAHNNTSYDLQKVYISAVVLTKEVLPIAVGSTILENFKSKERKSFSIPWFGEFSGTPYSVDLSISTNVWETPELLEL